MVSTRASRRSSKFSWTVSLLLEHLKKYPVSGTGGITLVKSVTTQLPLLCNYTNV